MGFWSEVKRIGGQVVNVVQKVTGSEPAALPGSFPQGGALTDGGVQERIERAVLRTGQIIGDVTGGLRTVADSISYATGAIGPIAAQRENQVVSNAAAVREAGPVTQALSRDRPSWAPAALLAAAAYFATRR